jgi:hypothetical protein
MLQTFQEPSVMTSGAGDFREYCDRMQAEPVHVILGVQGPGTNLLARLLTRLFNFSVMRDRSSVIQAGARLGHTPGVEQVHAEIQRFVSRVAPEGMLQKASKYVIHKNAPFKGVEKVFKASDIRTGAEFARLIYAYRGFSLGAAHLGIKSDDLWESIHALDDVIPNRRIILLTRDFRDNLLSVSGKQFGPIEPLCAASYVKHQLSYYAAEYRRAGAAGFHVKFETLLTDTHRFVTDFAAHFGLQLPPNLPAAIAALQFRPNKMGKWRALPDRQLAWCEGILRDELQEFGYGLVSNSPEVPGTGQLWAATARDTIKRVPQKVRWVAGRLRL